MKRAIVIAILALLAGACSARHDEQRTLTEAQRDSVLARENLPGATAVGAAMSRSDREAERAQSMNAMVDSLPR